MKLDKIKNVIIDYNFINQFYPSELNNLFKNNRKEIFIIEKCKNSKNKVYQTKVKLR